MMAKEKPPITVVGDVGGRIAIIVVRAALFSTFFSYTGHVTLKPTNWTSIY